MAPTFLPSRTGRFRPTSVAAAALDQHLQNSITELQPKPTTEGDHMRGLERLTSLAQTAMEDIDNQAGAAADRIVAAKERAAAAVEGFSNLAVSMEDKARLVERALAQLTNSPPAQTATEPETKTPVPPPPTPTG
jgi:hypothetical protein